MKYTLYDDRYGFKGMYALLCCQRCGHGYLDQKLTDEEISRLYTEYYPRSYYSVDNFQPRVKRNGFISWLNGENRYAYKWVPESVKVLDIGCGFCESLGYHRKRGCEVYGVEADSNVKRIADRYGFNVHIGTFDHNMYQDGYFDYVTMDQVIEHIQDPVGMLKAVSNILRKDGLLIISTPNPNGVGARLFRKKWINWHVPYHLNMFTKESIIISAEKTGFYILKAKAITPADWLNLQWRHMILKSEYGKKSNLWMFPKRRSFDNNMSKTWFYLVIVATKMVHLLKINHIISRLLDLAGYGESHLFILKKMQ